jgi:hypothetical protein
MILIFPCFTAKSTVKMIFSSFLRKQGSGKYQVLCDSRFRGNDKMGIFMNQGLRLPFENIRKVTAYL